MRLKDVSNTIKYDPKRKISNKDVKLKRTKSDLGKDWGEYRRIPKRSKYLIFLLIFSFIFFLGSVGLALVINRLGDDNEVSSNKITVLLQGAEIVNSGDTVPLTFKVANRNPVNISTSKIRVKYPAGVYRVTDTSRQVVSLTNQEYELGSIAKNEIKEQKITPIVYGTRDELKKLRYEFEYQIEGSSSVFIIENEYNLLIREPSVRIDSIKHTDIIAGKTAAFTFEVASNSDKNIETAILDVDYPVGFTFTNSSPRSINGKGDSWEIKNLKPAEKRTITIRVGVQGTDNEERAIKGEVSVTPTNDVNKLIVTDSKSTILAIGKSFIDARIYLRGSTNDYVGSPGEQISGYIEWANNSGKELRDVSIALSLTGEGLDKSSIKASDGDYEGDFNRIIWNKITERDFVVIDANDKGRLGFSFRTLPNQIEFSGDNKTIDLSVSVGAEIAGTGNLDLVRGLDTSQVRVGTTIQVVPNTLYATSQVKNLGPIPPKVGAKTSYVLQYFIKNNGNDLRDIVLTIPLENQVSFENNFSGLRADEISFDPSKKEITVSISNIASSGSAASRVIELQVFVTPSAPDVGGVLNLTKGSTFTALDSFIDKEINLSVTSLSTELTSEPLDRRAWFVVK